MDLINKKVNHKVFGKGIVTKYNDSYIEIDFSSESAGNRKFIFPDAFGTYLTLIDQKPNSVAKKMIQKRKKERKEEEVRLKRLKALQNEKRQYRLERERLLKKHRAQKIHPRSQSVFWCEEHEQDRVFADWRIFTGTIKSGQKEGQPKRLAQMGQNSACLLTAREPDMPEKDRRILGAFMVSETFSAKLCEDGYIPAHSEYRLRLSKDESEHMLFWNYYVNKRYPHKMTWNTGRHRYFENMWMAKILRDIIGLKTNPEERASVQRFFEYFCKMNRINEEEIPKPNGTLVQIGS